MILKKLYSQPEGLFDEVKFHNGVNFIFSEKTDPNDEQNGVGKSLLLDLIDFSLCANPSDRIKKAKESKEIVLEKYFIVLEFEINNQPFTIKRSFKNQKDIIFTVNGIEKTYEFDVIKEILCDLIFKNKDYEGVYKSSWLRQLIPFFIKINNRDKDNFKDPLLYLHRNITAKELIYYHLYLLGINNKILYENSNIVSEINKTDNIRDTIKKIISDNYQLNIKEVENEVSITKNEIKKLEEQIADFKLAEQYKDSEEEANDITIKIKRLVFENYKDISKLKSYNESLNLNNEVNIKEVYNLYSNINSSLGDIIKKSLEEAVEFRKLLVTSRKSFLEEEITSLKNNIKSRELEVAELEINRTKIYKFLEAKNAIEDLSNGYLMLSQRKDKMAELSNKISLYRDLEINIADLKAKQASLTSNLTKFLSDIREKEDNIREIFIDIFNSLYKKGNDAKAVFALVINKKKDQKLEIIIKFQDDLSEGKNHVRTLVYDLSVLFYSIKQNWNGPKFIIHDGIFNGVDKANLVSMYDFLTKKADNYTFQYILTYNDEGNLDDDKFGKGAAELTTEGIKAKSVIILSSKNKLFKKDFD